MNAQLIIGLVGALLTGLGVSQLLADRVKRRNAREDTREKNADERRTGVSVVEAETNQQVLNTLLGQMNARIEGYASQIVEMQAAHAKDIADVKAENRSLERRVQDLSTTLRDWQLGNRVPRGQVLVPLRDVRRVRERAPGILDSSWYPGEDPGPDDGNSIVARITPVDPPRTQP